MAACFICLLLFWTQHLDPSVWSQLLRLAFGLPIWLPKERCWLDSFLTIAARSLSLVMIIHNMPTIIKEKGPPGEFSKHWIRPTNMAANEFVLEWWMLDPVFISRSVTIACYLNHVNKFWITNLKHVQNFSGKTKTIDLDCSTSASREICFFT